jgi:hypothetical protein
MREIRSYGSEGGEAIMPFLPLLGAANTSVFSDIWGIFFPRSLAMTVYFFLSLRLLPTREWQLPDDMEKILEICLKNKYFGFFAN